VMCEYFCIDGHSEVDDDSSHKCTSFSMDFFSRLVYICRLCLLQDSIFYRKGNRVLILILME